MLEQFEAWWVASLFAGDGLRQQQVCAQVTATQGRVEAAKKCCLPSGK